MLRLSIHYYVLLSGAVWQSSTENSTPVNICMKSILILSTCSCSHTRNLTMVFFTFPLLYFCRIFPSGTHTRNPKLEYVCSAHTLWIRCVPECKFTVPKHSFPEGTRDQEIHHTHTLSLFSLFINQNIQLQLEYIYNYLAWQVFQFEWIWDIFTTGVKTLNPQSLFFPLICPCWLEDVSVL